MRLHLLKIILYSLRQERDVRKERGDVSELTSTIIWRIVRNSTAY